jgi:hypothetical protein
MKSGNLNFLEPPGQIQACNGTALNQLNGKNDAKQDEMQHTKERLGEVLKKKWKNKVMYGQYIRNMDR